MAQVHSIEVRKNEVKGTYQVIKLLNASELIYSIHLSEKEANAEKTLQEFNHGLIECLPSGRYIQDVYLSKDGQGIAETSATIQAKKFNSKKHNGLVWEVQPHAGYYGDFKDKRFKVVGFLVI